jgi:hypothetical protein
LNAELIETRMVLLLAHAAATPKHTSCLRSFFIGNLFPWTCGSKKRCTKKINHLLRILRVSDVVEILRIKMYTKILCQRIPSLKPSQQSSPQLSTPNLSQKYINSPVPRRRGGV